MEAGEEAERKVFVQFYDVLGDPLGPPVFDLILLDKKLNVETLYDWGGVSWSLPNETEYFTQIELKVGVALGDTVEKAWVEMGAYEEELLLLYSGEERLDPSNDALPVLQVFQRSYVVLEK